MAIVKPKELEVNFEGAWEGLKKELAKIMEEHQGVFSIRFYV